MGTRRPAARKRGVQLVSPETTSSTGGIVCSAVSPQLTEWVPELLAKLRPRTEQTIRNHAATDPCRTSSQLLAETLPAWQTLDNPWTNDIAEAVAYTRAITELALTYRDEPNSALTEYHQRRQAELTDTVTSIGTGRGPVNAGLGALARGPVVLHRELDDQPRVITLLLDGQAWTTLRDRRTGVRALATMAVLATGFDVRLVASPTVQRHLSKRYPDWTDCHLNLTDSRDRSPNTDHSSQSVDAAWEAIRDLDTEPGKRRLLGNLSTEYARSYRDLANDHAIDIADGTISNYVLDLETRNVVTVDRRGQQNTVQLTDLGKLAVQQCLDDNYGLVPSDQRRLGEGLTTTLQDDTSTVSSRRPGETRPTPDEWVAATGDPDGGGAYVQWLTGPADAPAHLHERFSTVAHENAITLVDGQPRSFEDSRVAYLSHTNKETLVVLQWGGPLATLGRLANALLSNKALSKILTPSRLGQEFETLHKTPDHDVSRILRRGHQVGWFSDDETTYEAWKQRITTVRDHLLVKVAELAGSDDTAARSDLFEDLHGLIASATQLYHAAGIDLTTTIRVPDTDALARNTTTLQDLCGFLAKTAPKQSAYGIHSGYRLLFEDRPEKLRRRLPYEPDQNATMDLTMSWVVAGPTATELRDEIATALDAELTEVREAIAEGTEAAPTLEIPVVDGTTYPAIRRVIDEIAMIQDVEWTPRERQRLIRLCLRSFGPADTQRACPYDVVVSLLRALNESHTPSPAAVERAAATLSPTRFRPDLTPTATKLYAALLRSDGPLGRSRLIERADISASSYDRRISAVRELDRVQAVQQGGHRRWTTTSPRTPPVTTWLPPHSGHRTTQLETHRDAPITEAGSWPPAHTSGPSSTDWGRQPPVRLTPCPAATTMYPRDTNSQRPNSHCTSDTTETPTHENARPIPTTAVATPQTQLPTGGHQ
ncbi:plasmid replication protein RepH [Halorubrum coriense DSM 10284]|uniref:Plasmid replication protein RepH n=1 Tax=Halorubrum coriense DSM 10284 TaxID=1227466 RepID=M0EAT1_9EURY|nr:hypothetical protein [Halorubrum coriense]ELZ44916.1 plasmid replication protein RepH [Halorubrum coriense DSM 10284]